MPPGQPLPDDQVQAFVDWVKMGAPDPRTGGARSSKSQPTTGKPRRSIGLISRLKDPQPPVIKDPAWSRTAIDRFIKSKLDEKGSASCRLPTDGSY